MTTTRSCPRPEEIWALLDGDQPQGRELKLRMHLDACEECRQVVISARRLEGVLRVPEVKHGEPEFESEFRSRLMRRLATSGEERRARVIRPFARRGRVAAAVLLLAVAVGSGTWGRESLSSSRSEATLARAERERAREELDAKRAAARLDLVDALHDFGEQRPVAAASLSRLEQQFAEVKLGLADEVLGLLEFADAPLRRGVLAFMGRHRSTRYLPALRGLIARGERPLEEVEESALLALAEQGTPGALEVLADIARDSDLSAERRCFAIDALVRRPSLSADATLARILRERGPRTGASTIARLIERDDSASVSMLRDLYLRGHQSDRLLAVLSERADTPRWLRRRLSSPRLSGDEARRLIRLAGSTQDSGMLRGLVPWIDREEYATLSALVALNTPGALDTVAGRLVLGVRQDDARMKKRHTAALRALGRAKKGRAEYFLRRFSESQGKRSRRFLIAAGACRDARVLGELEALTAHDDVEVAAVQALAALGTPEAVEALERLLESEDPGLRREAARQLAFREKK